MKKVFYLLSLLTMLTCTSCSDDTPPDTPPAPPTLDEVKTGIIGIWKSSEMRLIFTPENTLHITHGEIMREGKDYSFSHNGRNEEIRINQIKTINGLVGILMDGEYMYVHKLTENILKIEFYGEGITFTLTRSNNSEEEITCYICDGNGTRREGLCSWCFGEGYWYDCNAVTGNCRKKKCTRCNGKGYEREETCYNCDGKGYTIYSPH